MTLADLDDRVRDDLAVLNVPAANWVPLQPLSAGAALDAVPVLDTVIVGAGMLGLSVSFALQRLGIRNHVVLDRAAPGQEGPWVTYARMETLRSPKHLVGPAQDIPNLTFRAWYTAQHGRAGWDALGKIPRATWMQYLTWFRTVLSLPVTNGVAIQAVRPGPDGLAEIDTDAAGTLLARHVVLATGRDGLGAPRMPDWVPADRGPRIRHSMEPIPFADLAGQHVAVVGASASAVDNAATALEHGAASVHLLVRRSALPTLNRFKSLVHAGYTHGFAALDDGTRLAVLRAAFEGAVAPPRESVLRLARHPGFHLHLSAPVQGVDEDADGVTVSTPGGPLRVAMLILGTGFAVDLTRRPELAAAAHVAKRWRDTGLDAETLGEFADYPTLGPGFELQERVPGAAPWLGRVHAFSIGAVASQGLVSGDIPGVGDGARRLAEAIARSLFVADADQHLAMLRAYADPELLGDEIPPGRVAAAACRSVRPASAPLDTVS